MNELALRILLLSPAMIFVAYFGAALVGGLLAGIFQPVRFSLTRGAYVLFYGLCLLLSLLSSLIMLKVPQAIVGGYLWLPVGVSLLMVVFAGYALIAISKARSNDVQDDAGLAWLSFIPLICLYLFFASRKVDQSEPRRFSLVMEGFSGPVGVVLGVLAMLAYAVGNRQAQHIAARQMAEFALNSEGQLALYDLKLDSLGLADVLAEEARRVVTPVEVAPGIILRSLTASESTLHYEFTGVPTASGEQLRKIVATALCAEASARKILDLAGRYEYRYLGDDGTLEIEYSVTAADCPA